MRTATTRIIERIAAQDVVIASGSTTNSFTFRLPGLLRGIRYATNNNTNNVTTVITVVDDESSTLYTSAALNENTTGYLKPDVCLYNSNHTLVCTSADPGVSTNIISITLLVER